MEKIKINHIFKNGNIRNVDDIFIPYNKETMAAYEIEAAHKRKLYKEMLGSRIL